MPISAVGKSDSMVTKSNTDYAILEKGLGLRRLKGSSDNKTKIFFFPFVGGQSLSFKDIARGLPEGIEVLAIDFPGHGWARGECIKDFEELINLLSNVLLEYLGDNFYFFGHSLGGILAYRITQILEEKNIKPKKVIISASPLPHRIEEYKYLDKKSMKELVEIMSGFGSINSAFLDNQTYLEYYFRTIKDDIAVFLKTKVDMDKPIESPSFIFYSEEDSFVKYTDIFEWGIYGQDVSFVKVKGDHIFVQTEYEEVTKKIIDLL
ncbi:alpha/beta fold hydrolase [Ruminiclostridium papyrosolvens DSM 2782]|uniref:thioesterase II family protein n=1 Tax=Ruminiclostridium papyrosolvens TaxID=29362 RepID=UPI0023E3E06C|nr:alpha/beta fold hydrolase [Ruminiclostridium papyrosolvens]WES34058.1 alpha/beta fold hydrolase [Ruminiclostridium papyrosolvens DSM 2782]